MKLQALQLLDMHGLTGGQTPLNSVLLKWIPLHRKRYFHYSGLSALWPRITTTSCRGLCLSLAGNNDPAVALGWSQHKVKRMKRELREANLITSSWNGFGNPYRVYVTLSVGANLRQRKSATTQDTTDENSPSRKVQICTPVGCKSAPTASYIRKTKKKDQEERPRATASQSPRPTGLPPEFWEAYEQECRKEEAAKMRKEKKDDQEGSNGSDDLPTEIL